MKRTNYLTMIMVFSMSIINVQNKSIAQSIDMNILVNTLEVLPVAYVNEGYGVSITTINQSGNVTWNVDTPIPGNPGFTLNVPSGSVDPTLPAGQVTFNNSGGGIPGDYNFTLNVIDDGLNEAFKEFTLPVQRRPVSVVLVLDRSGSMGAAPHGGSGSIDRMDILHTAASLFVNKLDAFDITGDEAAITYFESTIDTPPPAFGNTLTPIGGNAGNFTGDITSQSPGSATAMGGGLLAAKTKLGSAATDNRQFVFLFTDGEQNVAPLVNDAGTQAGTDPLNNVDNSIQIVTIGTGAAAGMAPALRLQAIAEQNTGKNPPTDGTPRYFLLQEEVDPLGVGTDFNTFTTIVDFFDTGFESMLRGNSPQTVDVKQGTVPAGATSAESFTINANIYRIVFELLTPDQEPFFAISKDGTPITSNNANLQYIFGPNNGTNSLLAVLDLSQSPSSGLTSVGEWKVVIRSGTGGNKPYQMKVQVDDHRLNYTFEVSAADFKVGDDLLFNAELSYDGIPINDANFQVIVLKPGEDLGDLLAQADINFDPSGRDESGSVGYQKLLAAIQDDPDLIAAIQLQEKVFSLSSSGNGRYQGSFSGNQTNVSGVYQIITTLTGTDDSIGDYKRRIRRTAYLRFADPEPEVSVQQYTVVDDNTLNILFTPKYTVENKVRFVGPGFAQAINAIGNGINMNNVQDNGDGSYLITMKGNTNAEVEISIGGVVVPSEEKGKGGFCNWVENTFHIPCWVGIIILILIVILIIIILIRRKSGNN